jgi:hypothetical protein
MKAAHALKSQCAKLHRDYILGHIRPQSLDEIVDDYIGPVELRFSPGKGRGLFTTRAVEANELLLMERAFAKAKVKTNLNVFHMPTLDFSSMLGFRPEAELMIELILARVLSSEADAARFGLLDDGSDGFEMQIPTDMNFFRVDEHPDITKSTTSHPTVNRIRNVLRLNSFGDEASSAVFVVGSFLNHSVRPNTIRIISKKSNLMVVAHCAMPAGTELFTSYGPEEKLSNWGISPER